MWRSRRPSKRVTRPVENLSAIIPAVGKSFNLDRKVQEWTVCSLWEQVIDPPFKGKTQATKIKATQTENQLLVMVQSAGVAAELQFFLEEYRDRLNRFAPQTEITIHKIQTRVGRLG